MRDFSLPMLQVLLMTFRDRGFQIVRFDRYWQHRDEIDREERVVLLRHDVDRFPMRALDVARMESKLGVYGTYFFRVKPWVFKETIIREIADLGHEIGYHYENLADARGDFERARELFTTCLGRLRSLYPVISASMHSRPLSKFDNRTFWDKFSLDEFGLSGEPYRSIDHNVYMYVADSGRDWNADRNVVWDSVDGLQPPRMEEGTRGLVREVERGGSIRRVQLLIHPCRWPATVPSFVAQYMLDKFINTGKSMVKRYRRLSK